MGHGEPDRGKDLVRGLGENANHRFGNDGLFIDDGLDLGQRSHRLFAFARHQVIGDDEAYEELSCEGDLHPRSRACLAMRRGKACRKAIVEESIEGHGQRDAQDAFVCGIVRAERRQAVEKGGGHGEILCTAGAPGKAASSNR